MRLNENELTKETNKSCSIAANKRKEIFLIDFGRKTLKLLSIWLF